jgi:hypothetical protein
MFDGKKQLDELQFVLPDDADFSLTHGNTDTISFLFDKVDCGDDGNGELWDTGNLDACDLQVFGPEASQAEVFDEVVHDTAVAAVEGINGTVFAYGQTGYARTVRLLACCRWMRISDSNSGPVGPAKHTRSAVAAILMTEA